MNPENITPLWVETQADLRSLCQRWSDLEAIGIDTEFVRERTFYPGLGLIQISDDECHALIDPLAIEDLEPLTRLLRNAAVTKIFHSCGEDLEVLYHRFGAFPQPLFDTQIAAAFAGHGYSMGYGRLVEHLFEVHLPKGQTRTNWLRRPLSEAQKRYAAHDSAFLLPAWRRLTQQLTASGRLDWAREEFARLPNAERFLPDPETLYLKVTRARSLSRRQLGLLQILFRWREKTARQKDLPRNFVVPEPALLQIAKKPPRSLSQLRTIPALQDSDVRRHGSTVLELIEKAYQLDSDQLPAESPAIVDLSPYRTKLKELRQVVIDRAEELGLPAELLATTKTLKSLLRGHIAEDQPTLPEELSGWRREAIGQPLLKRL